MSDQNTTEPADNEAADDEAQAGAAAKIESAGDQSTVSEQNPESAPKRGHGGSWAWRVTKAVAVVAAIGGVGVLYFWWQGRQSIDGTGADEAFVLQSLEDTLAALARLEGRLQSLESGLGASAARVDSLNSDVEVLPAELRELRRQIEALQGGRLDSRESWLREQAAYYLVLANTELGIGGRAESAITALELADDVLRDLGDPVFAEARRAIAFELQTLREIERPDFERYLADLAGLIARVSDLPMRSAVPENFNAPEDSLDDVEPGLGRLWERTRGSGKSIVRVERQEEPVAVLLTASERRIVRRQLALELQLARTALFERRQVVFRASLVAADGIINRDFDRGAQSIIEARRMLAEMMRIDVDPALPRIGDSLALLRAAFGDE